MCQIQPAKIWIKSLTLQHNMLDMLVFLEKMGLSKLWLSSCGAPTLPWPSGEDPTRWQSEGIGSCLLAKHQPELFKIYTKVTCVSLMSSLPHCQCFFGEMQKTETRRGVFAISPRLSFSNCPPIGGDGHETGGHCGALVFEGGV